MLSKGTKAPDFNLYSTPDQKLKLTDFAGKRLILAFYPADWSPVCCDQMSLYNETLKYFKKHNADIVGISVDGKWCHTAFEKDRKLHFPLLADFEPKGEISKAYGVYNEAEGQSQRALFVIDEKGIIQWSYLSPDGINPGADGILDALEKLESKTRSPNFNNTIMLKPPVNKQDHATGPENAAITLVEYGDYECPYCGEAYPIIKNIQQQMGNNLRFVFRNFPLQESHPDAFGAAIAAEAAGKQNAFWQMHDLIYENQDRLSNTALIGYATELKLNIKTFTADIEDEALKEKIDADLESGIRSGVNGTPAFFINGNRYDGSWEDKNLLHALQRILQE